MDGHERFSICTSIMPFFPGYMSFSYSTGFQSPRDWTPQIHLPPKQDIPPRLATQRHRSAPSGDLYVTEWGRYGSAALCQPAEEASASSPGCTGHRCAALCFPRRSAHTYRRHRRGGALGVGRVRIGKPVKRCIHILVITQSRQVFQVKRRCYFI